MIEFFERPHKGVFIIGHNTTIYGVTKNTRMLLSLLPKSHHCIALLLEVNNPGRRALKIHMHHCEALRIGKGSIVGNEVTHWIRGVSWIWLLSERQAEPDASAPNPAADPIVDIEWWRKKGTGNTYEGQWPRTERRKEIGSRHDQRKHLPDSCPGSGPNIQGCNMICVKIALICMNGNFEIYI